MRLAYDGSCIVNAAPIINWLNMMGQPFNGRQTPDGYAMTESAWASPGQMTVRFDVARSIAFGTPALFQKQISRFQQKNRVHRLLQARCMSKLGADIQQRHTTDITTGSHTTEGVPYFSPRRK